jgi:hypothetical protein
MTGSALQAALGVDLATRSAVAEPYDAERGPLRPSRLDMSGRSGWERVPGVVARPLLRLVLGALSVGLNVLSRVNGRVRAQVTRTLSFEISTADGVRRRWMFDGSTRRITSTAHPTGEADHRVHFRSSAQGIGVLTSTRAIDAAVDGLVRHRIQLEGSAFIVIWFYGLTRRVVKIGRTRGPREPVPHAYVCPDASRDGPETIVREPAVNELDPTWRGAWDARATLCMVRGPGGEPMPEP